MLGRFSPLELTHQKLLNEYLSRFQPETSELTFLNLWVWCMCHPVWIYEEKDTLFILRKQDQGVFYGFIPLGKEGTVGKVHRLKELMNEFDMKFRMDRVGEKAALELKAAGYCIRENQDQHDYVYRGEDLAELAGRKYSRKRNHIKKCLNRYDCTFQIIKPRDLPACHGFLQEWCKLRNCAENPELCCEQRAIRFMLYDYKKFHVIGGMLKVNGEIAAVTFGEKLNDNTAVIHFEKAHPEIDGSYPLINQWFCKYALKDFEWINREQDLGTAGLRKAKQSYYPDHQVRKYIIS